MDSITTIAHGLSDKSFRDTGVREVTIRRPGMMLRSLDEWYQLGMKW